MKTTLYDTLNIGFLVDEKRTASINSEPGLDRNISDWNKVFYLLW